MNIDDLFSEVNQELEQEADSSLNPKDRQLKAISQRLLQLEKDLRVPGASTSTQRIERLLDAIQKEDF